MKRAFAVLIVVLLALTVVLAAKTSVTINYTVSEIFNFSVIFTERNSEIPTSEFHIPSGHRTFAFDLRDTTITNASTAKAYSISASASNWTGTDTAPIVTLEAYGDAIKEEDEVVVKFDGTKIVDNSVNSVKVAEVNVDLNNETLLAGSYKSTITLQFSLRA